MQILPVQLKRRTYKDLNDHGKEKKRANGNWVVLGCSIVGLSAGILTWKVKHQARVL